MVAADLVGGGSRARLAPTAAGTGAPARVAAPTSCVLAARGRPTDASHRRPRRQQAPEAHDGHGQRHTDGEERPVDVDADLGIEVAAEPDREPCRQRERGDGRRDAPDGDGKDVRRHESGGEPAAVEADGAQHREHLGAGADRPHDRLPDQHDGGEHHRHGEQQEGGPLDVE